MASFSVVRPFQKMGEYITLHFFLNDILFLGMTLGAGVLHILQWYFIFSQLSLLNQPNREYIALHTKQFFGVDFYSDWYTVFLIPLGGLLILVVNYFIAKKIGSSNRVFFIAILGTSLWSQFALCIVIFRIIQLNIF